ncbi:MAG: bacteriohemerythrin [Deltaproteobacteria bacterium]|jgi:hemerythrin-like metal-binding protein|nr:bacteriohemerythrin [Deltaproteobacteria bacterium]
MLWTKSLETGVAKIDEQHKELFRQVDILVDRSQADRIEKTLEFLKSYVAKHFADEEYLQKINNYPKAEAHKKLHVDFTKTFKELYDKYKTAGDRKLTVVLSINSAVIGWLKDHIMVHDKEFATYYLAKNQARK